MRHLHLALLHLYQRLPRRARVAVVHSFSPSFTVGSICIIERADGRVLLVRHSYRRRWGFPGGLLKRGEEVDEAARREVREEVGLEIELVGEPAVVVAPKPRRVDVVYRGVPAEGVDPDAAQPLSPEIVEVRWMTWAELPELQHEAVSGLKAVSRRTG